MEKKGTHTERGDEGWRKVGDHIYGTEMKTSNEGVREDVPRSIVVKLKKWDSKELHIFRDSKDFYS